MQPNEGQPIYILNPGAEQSGGRTAQRSNIAAAKAVAECVRTTLGPHGADKMLVSGESQVVITNDGATILRELDAEHPAAKLVISVAESQEKNAHDGTTTAVIIAGALLDNCEQLLDLPIHRTVICKGLRDAQGWCEKLLDDNKGSLTRSDMNLIDVAKTTLTGKSAESELELIAELVIEAAKSVADGNKRGLIDLEDVKILTFTGASFKDSEVLTGCLIEKEPLHSQMPKSAFGKILCFTGNIETKEVKQDAQLSISDPESLEKFLAKEEENLRGMVSKIEKAGASILIVQKAIDDLAVHYLSRAGILALSRVKSSDLEMVRRITGATLVESLDDLHRKDLGVAEAEVVAYGEHLCTHIKDVSPKAPRASYLLGTKPVTVILRGVSSHTTDELERAFDDCIGVLSVAAEDNEYVTGGGSAYQFLASYVRQRAATIGGREQMAMEAFAEALESVPRTLIENSGGDPVDGMIDLKLKQKTDGHCQWGVGLDGTPTHMGQQGVWEPSRIIRTALKSATEAAIAIIRIDDVISMKASTPMQSPPGGMGGMGL